MPESMARSPLGYMATRQRLPSASDLRSERIRWPVLLLGVDDDDDGVSGIFSPRVGKWSNLKVSVEIVGGGILILICFVVLVFFYCCSKSMRRI